MTASSGDHSSHSQSLGLLVIGAIGVVFGDIGTSPLYAIRECFHGSHGLELSSEALFQVLSLIFWLVTMVVTVKYVSLILRADNRGEGGNLALLALASHAVSRHALMVWLVAIVGIFGASLFYADAILTPAISVLSAVEGIGVYSDALTPHVLPISATILIMLFIVQRQGTAQVGKFFGPVMLLWFLVLATLGALSIAQTPEVLQALSPHYAVAFFLKSPMIALMVLGAAVLSVTGAEALYADMGHFGRFPIRLSWVLIAFPCLMMNYFGQGALLLREPEAIENPFFLLVSDDMVLPLVMLATAATVIASQATISGAFSLTRQAIQLGYFPRLAIQHTSHSEIGQIYVPFVNWALLLSVMVVVFTFQSSSNLANAYGIAVTGSMLCDSLMIGVVLLFAWRWPLALMLAVTLPFLVLDATLVTANAVKIMHGGWMPLALAIALFTILTSWNRGQKILAHKHRSDAVTIGSFMEKIGSYDYSRAPGTAIFMSPRRGLVPPAFLHNIRHNKVIHERVIFLTVLPQEVPTIPDNERIEVSDLGMNFYKVLFRLGFKDEPDVPAILPLLEPLGLRVNMDESSFFLEHDTIIPTVGDGMATWREHLFAWMKRNSASAADFFKLPPERVVELGGQTEI